MDTSITSSSTSFPDPSVPNADIDYFVEKPITSSPFKNVIFDLGDVLFSWKPSQGGVRIPPLTFKHILRSVIWFDHEKGLLSLEDAYNLISQEYGIAIEDVVSSFDAARATLQTNDKVFELIREIKDAGFHVFAMSNVSSFDCDFMASKADPADWALFERIFTSANAHERKPHLGFYSYVISEAGLDPARTIFIDDKSENVLSARSFGMHGIRFEDFDSLSRQLRNLCGDPVERGNSFLLANKARLFSTTSRGFVLHENYSQLLLWEATGDRSMVDLDESTHVNFFRGSICPKEVMGDLAWLEHFPDDLDCTAIGLTVYTHLDLETKDNVMDEIISLRTADGLVPVYFSKSRPRIDLAVCINVLTLFYRHNRGHELDTVLDWVYNCVLHGAYLDGTLYYTTPEVVLWFLTRLLQSSPRVRQRFEPLFKRRIAERLNMDGNSLALAMRIISAAEVGIESPFDVKKLLSLQQQDGSWTDGWFYKFPRTALCVKNDGFATALAVKAIQVAERLKNNNFHWATTYISQTRLLSSDGCSMDVGDVDENSDMSTESGDSGSVRMHMDHDTDTSTDDSECDESRIEVDRRDVLCGYVLKDNTITSDVHASPSAPIDTLTEDFIPLQAADACHSPTHDIEAHDTGGGPKEQSKELPTLSTQSPLL